MDFYYTKCLSITNYSIEIKHKIHQKINHFFYCLNYALKNSNYFEEELNHLLKELNQEGELDYILNKDLDWIKYEERANNLLKKRNE